MSHRPDAVYGFEILHDVLPPGIGPGWFLLGLLFSVNQTFL
jgi:hypothetical protein